MVGEFTNSSNVTHGFIRNASGSFTTIDPPGSTLTEANAINDKGKIVGDFDGSKIVRHGFIRCPSGGFVTVDVPRSNFTEALGINNYNEIVGTSRIPVINNMAF